MLDKLFGPGDWYAQKKLGYGAGMPIAWQGWALLIGYCLIMIALAFAAESVSFAALAVIVGVMVLLTIAVLLIAKRRTRDGWRWRP